MALTTAQRTILAAHIRANSDPTVVAALAVRNDNAIVTVYNADSSFVAWRNQIEPDEYREALDWTEVDNLTNGKARIWEWLTQGMTVSINASKANVRAGLNNAFNNTTTKTNLLAIATRFATLAESLFATGTGSTQSPGVLVFDGDITAEDVGRALNENP